ncbi:MAG: LamG domain-containing protein [Spirochaetales bacterium]
MVRRALAFVMLLGAILIAANADRLQLANGDIISGTIVRIDEDLVVIDTEYGRLEIERDRVVRGSFGGEISIDPEIGEGEPDDEPSESPENDDRTSSRADSDSQVPSIDDGLLFHFTLDENLRDQTGNYQIVNNGMRSTTGPRGGGNSALRSDGSGTYLSVATDRRINELDAFTIAFWINPENNAPTQYLVSKWTRADAESANGKFTLQTARGGLTLFLVNEEGRYEWVTARGVLQENEWQSVAVTFEDGRAVLFVNGEEVGFKLFDFENLFEEDAPILFMTAESATEDAFGYYNTLGSIDDVRLYDHALSDTEVALLAAIGR